MTAHYREDRMSIVWLCSHGLAPGPSVTPWALFSASILASGFGQPRARSLGEALGSVLLLGQGAPLATVT